MRKLANDIVTGLLLLSAVVMTTLVWLDRRDVETREDPKRVDDWQEVAALGTRLGPTDAPVQIVEFVDLQCPFCARFHDTLKGVLEEHGSDVAWTFLHYPISGHDQAVQAAVAAECAADQGQFFAFVDHAFQNQEVYADEPWTEFAMRAGVTDVEAFERCLTAGVDAHPEIMAGKTAGQEIGITGTPAVIINGWLQASVPHENLDSIVRSELQKGR